MAKKKSADGIDSPIIKFGIVFIFVAAILLVAYVARNFY